MGFLSSIGGAIKEGFRSGLVNGILDATGYSSVTGQMQYLPYEYDAYGNVIGINSAFTNNVSDRYGTSNNGKEKTPYDGKGGGLTAGTTIARNIADSNNQRITDFPNKYSHAKNSNVNISNLTHYANEHSETNINYNKANHKIKEDSLSDLYGIKLPNWSYADFINERAMWQKGVSSILDEPAWFYFKIFFDFDTNHGLFGGLLNSSYLYSATNSAAKYLYTVRNLHKNNKSRDRINALYKFASILSYINTNAPWYFKAINGLDKAVNPVMDEFNKERSIEIQLNVDAVDMRLSSLMSLYSYACYDTLLYREAIPENLRKFNMSIILFQSPLRYLHTSFTTRKKKEFLGISTDNLGLSDLMNNISPTKIKYKTMDFVGDPNNAMSMKILSFYGCEFSKDTISSYVPGSITNETPFQMGNNILKITYTFATEHNMNEFYGMLFGSDGFYFNHYSNFQTDDANFNGYFNKRSDGMKTQLERYEALGATLDNLAQGGSILGIIDAPKSYTEAVDATEAVMNGIMDSKNTLTSMGVNFALGLLGSSRNTYQTLGNLYGDYGIGSAYYKDKLEMLKNGVHERTQAPYYYDPKTGQKRELHNSKNYTAYNYKNDKESISRFNMSNWLNTGATNTGISINDSLR